MKPEGQILYKGTFRAKIDEAEFVGILHNAAVRSYPTPEWCKHPEESRTPMYAHDAYPYVPFRMLGTAPQPVGYQCGSCNAVVRNAISK